MSFENASSKFSVDLFEKAKEHLTFLRAVHSSGISLRTPSNESLRRYEELWLPLVHENQSIDLVPPGDVAWLWHCHRLAPKSYEKYLQDKFGKGSPVLEANAAFMLQSPTDSPVTTAANPSSCDQTRKLWKSKYPNEDFFLSSTAEKSSSTPSWWKKWTGFDFVGTTKRQASFLWQVSGPNFSDPEFLKQGVQEYYKFLNLKNLAQPSQIIVPTIQIDLLWHTHILASQSSYAKDCKAIMKTEFNHDDSIDDSNLESYFNETKALWKKHYGEDYYVVGGMNRGEPPEEFFKPEWAVSTSGSVARTILWCWQESPNRIDGHDKSMIVGTARDGWIQYDSEASSNLEKAFNEQRGTGVCSPCSGYVVDFVRMKQVNIKTEFERSVQRVAVVWCWQETPSLVSGHDPASIFGPPEDGMIKYDAAACVKLETAFQLQHGTGRCSPSDGYMVDFGSMQQTKIASGYKRSVTREYVTMNQYIPPFATAKLIGENGTSEESADPPIVTDVVAVPVSQTGAVPKTKVSEQALPSPNPRVDAPNKKVNAVCICMSFCCCICVIIVVVVLLAVIGLAVDDTDSATGIETSFTSAPSMIAVTNPPTSAPIFSTASPSPQVDAWDETTNPFSNNDPGKRWLCGSAPDLNYVRYRNLPSCLRVEPVVSGGPYRTPDRPLCMHGGESLSDPPVWCYADQSAYYSSYYLWWSPCTKCGTAWRMDEERDDDKSQFKSPADRPGASDMPPTGYDWLRWAGSSWYNDVDVVIYECEPEECWVSSSTYADSHTYQQDSSGGFGGIVDIIIGFFVVIVIGLCCAFASKGCPCEGGGGRHVWGGGGCGGGGGGGGCKYCISVPGCSKHLILNC